MTTLKENTELQGKVDEDEDDIDSLTEKNRQLVKQVWAISQFISLDTDPLSIPRSVFRFTSVKTLGKIVGSPTPFLS